MGLIKVSKQMGQSHSFSLKRRVHSDNSSKKGDTFFPGSVFHGVVPHARKHDLLEVAGVEDS